MAEVIPADLAFKFVLNKQLLATITIKNSHSSRLAFKIKTTAPKKYVVRPSSGIADANSAVTIQVIMQAQKEYPADFANCKDKFMVQTCVLDDEEQIEKDTFNKEGGKDLKEARLRVILEGPAAPPSPVPEANETEDVGSLDASGAAAAAGILSSGIAASDGPSNARLKTAMGDLSTVTAENNRLATAVDKLKRERDDLRKQLDQIQLQSARKGPAGGTGGAAVAAGGLASASQIRLTLLHLIAVAIIAFLIGHFT